MIGLLDASSTPKSGKQTFGLDRFYNGSHGRVERGLEISLLAVVDTVTEMPMLFMPPRPTVRASIRWSLGQSTI